MAVLLKTRLALLSLNSFGAGAAAYGVVDSLNYGAIGTLSHGNYLAALAAGLTFSYFTRNVVKQFKDLAQYEIDSSAFPTRRGRGKQDKAGVEQSAAPAN